MNASIAAAFACAGSLQFATAATAADIYSPVTSAVEKVETEDGWTFSVTPYFWAAGLSGDVASFGLPAVNVDLDFGDILDNLDFAAMAVGEARYDRYSIFGDILYVKVSNSKGTPRGILASSASVTSESFAGLIGAGYSLVDESPGRLDIIGGIRVWSVDNKFSFSGGVLDDVSRSDSATWVDAVAGLRGHYSITPNIYLTGWGYAGAGGANIDWDLAGAVGYRFNDTFSGLIGYRALGVDYRNDGFVYDVVQQGPIFGLTIRF